MNQTKVLVFILILVICSSFMLLIYLVNIPIQTYFEKVFATPLYYAKQAPKVIVPQPTEPPDIFPTNLPTSVKPADAYTIILVGDSMTQFLGNNTDALRKYLKSYYCDENCTPKGKVFGIFNLGFGSTNILSLQDRIEKESFFSGNQYQSILSREFDLIIIESFGNNPLSEYPLTEGLEKQNQALEKAVKTIHKAKPNTVIAFLATIAPLRNRYAEGTVVLTPEKRQQWADERIAYINNHIKFAQDHDLPLINVYEKSLKDGDGNIDFINTSDFIHPSVTGVDFISKEIADWIYNNRVLPL